MCRPDKIIPLRNLFFVMLASYYGDKICLGATYGDRVLDKSVIFAQKASGLLSFRFPQMADEPAVHAAGIQQ